MPRRGTEKMKGKKEKKSMKKSSKSKSKAKSPSKASASQKGERRKMRLKPGTLALREIKRYQKDIRHVIPRAPFARVVRSIA